MDMVFDRGSSDSPRGHAFIFFRSSSDPEEVWACYLVMLPINVDVSKYVPPFLMGQVADLSPKDLSAFAFPPVPEKFDGHERLQRLAEVRGDDLLFCGSLNVTNVASMMMRVGEAVQSYADLYARLVPIAEPEAEPHDEEELKGFSVSEVMYELMSDSEKLSELTKLVGKLRYAMEGGESALAREAESDIRVLSRQLSESYQVAKIVNAAKSGGDRGERLTGLFLKRSFHLVQEEYVKVGTVEAEIRALEAEETA